MTIPSKSPITPGYGFGSTLPPYSASNPHNGVDFQHAPDNRIYAPFSGKVIHGYNSKDGNGTYMYAPNGDFHGLLHANAYLVGDGALVTEGQPIAIMGETGAAEGVHLHWCVKRNNVFIDPMSLIKEEDMKVNQDQLDKICWLATGLSTKTADAFQNNLGLELDEVLQNFMGYTETRNLHWDAEAFRAGQVAAQQLKPGIYEVK